MLRFWVSSQYRNERIEPQRLGLSPKSKSSCSEVGWRVPGIKEGRKRHLPQLVVKITQPTLIVHGNKDIVVDPINALLLAEKLPNAQLIVFPASSHGAQFQYAAMFLEHVKLFLNEKEEVR